ncbi:sugar transferase [Priestia megaterium]|uniref:sugar transferase n=2 Tax=Priestia megaterium TaxID=1404 RepID=UPI0020C767E8|nr:sugar transferase [Priestia megaterium]
MKFERGASRLIDIILAITFIIILLPIMLIIFLLIKLDSRGPVLFKQQRIGKDGEAFLILKFRTMIINSEQKLKGNPVLYRKYIENSYKLDPSEDPRITKLGEFLRKTSLDEIPQFLNVLIGDMAIVGPRPVLLDELKEYGNKREIFLSVKPGITGYWQVSGRSNIGYPERVNLELYYIERKNILFDISIIGKTFISVLKKKGAY